MPPPSCLLPPASCLASSFFFPAILLIFVDSISSHSSFPSSSCFSYHISIMFFFCSSPFIFTRFIVYFLLCLNSTPSFHFLLLLTFYSIFPFICFSQVMTLSGLLLHRNIKMHTFFFYPQKMFLTLDHTTIFPLRRQHTENIAPHFIFSVTSVRVKHQQHNHQRSHGIICQVVHAYTWHFDEPSLC